jgi:hypothetical protein
MSLSEYRSPVVKKPKFGWQRYQFGNKSAAELKLSLWDANLSEVSLKPTIITTVPGAQKAKVTLNLKITSKVTGTGSPKNFVVAGMTISPYTTQAQLASELNKALPYLGQFVYHDDLQAIVLTIDKTYLNNNPLDEFDLVSQFEIALTL